MTEFLAILKAVGANPIQAILIALLIFAVTILFRRLDRKEDEFKGEMRRHESELKSVNARYVDSVERIVASNHEFLSSVKRALDAMRNELVEHQQQEAVRWEKQEHVFGELHDWLIQHNRWNGADRRT